MKLSLSFGVIVEMSLNFGQVINQRWMVLVFLGQFIDEGPIQILEDGLAGQTESVAEAFRNTHILNIA